VSSASVTLKPSQNTERFELVDCVRGVALFGIITANMVLYSLFLYLPEASRAALPTHASDRVLDFLELFLIEGKFYTIFSTLFGLGFSILLLRVRAKGLDFRRFYLRRVCFLYLIGLLHAILFFSDDILEAYAVCGALLLLLVGARDRTILIVAAVALFALPVAIKLAGGIPDGALTAFRDGLFVRFGIVKDARIDIYTHGSLLRIWLVNLIQIVGQIRFLVTSGMLFKIYGCFLIGFWLGRHEVYKLPATWKPALKRLAIAGFAIGLPLNFVYARSFETGSWAETLSSAFGIIPLSAAYVAVCGLLWLDERGRRLLQVFAPVGRMALTNYVGQSVICSFIFWSTGLALGGTMGPTKYLPVGLVIYGFQVLASRWWLARFRFGPLEWIWRMLTYGQWLPIAKRPAAAAEAA
jgi:uncharacterized protein